MILREIRKKLNISNIFHIKECHGIIFMIDGSEKEKINDTLSCLREVLKHDDLEGVPFLICINKLVILIKKDLEEAPIDILNSLDVENIRREFLL